MNKLLTYPGIMPVWLGDIDFMTEAVRASFFQMLQGLTGQDNPTCILHGAEITNATVSAGVVVLGGEILPSASATAADNIYYIKGFNIERTLEGTRTFKDGEEHSCHEVRVAVPVLPTSGITPEYPMYDDDFNAIIPRLPDILGERANYVRLSGNYTSNKNGLRGNVTIQYLGRMFFCKGTFNVEQSVADVTTLWSDTVTYKPGLMGYINEGVTCFPVTVSDGDDMEIIPAKMTITKSGTSYTTSITIPAKTFAVGSVLSLSFILNSI